METNYILAAENINPVLPHLSEIIIGLISFLLLLFVIKKFVSPRFESLYAQRTAQIEGGIKKAEQAQAEAAAALEQYQAQLAGARAEAARIRDDAQLDGQRILEEMRAKAQEESARIVASGHAQLASQRAQIVAELRGELGRLAVDLADRVVGEALQDDARRAGTVDRFLEELGETSARAVK